jgi:modulator of FtsH protease
MIGIESHWTDFFIAEVGATAALAGLIIVAISINVQQILAVGHLPGRAREALTLLFSALLISSLALIPDQGPRLLGGEILVLELVVLVNAAISQFRALGIKPQQVSWIVNRVISVTLTCTPVVIGGILLASGNAAGLYWVAPGILVAIVVSAINTWVLLIEILR